MLPVLPKLQGSQQSAERSSNEGDQAGAGPSLIPPDRPLKRLAAMPVVGQASRVVLQRGSVHSPTQ